jgi:type 1 fimbriae regulatory protein FimB/type 1 fimbriae regulatory protein FimE
MSEITPLPNNENRTVTPKRLLNSELRTREYLLPEEVDALIAAAKKGDYGHRDATLILTAYRHGLRAVEACELQWVQLDFGAAKMHVRRVKNGTPSVHPILGDELRALRRLKREQKPSAFVFTSERGAPFAPDSLNKQIKRLGAKTSLPFPVHFHMLRHARGYVLVADGMDIRAIQAYLGHAAIQHTIRYAALSAEPFSAMRR